MNELLEQFLSEAREALEGIGDKLMALEQAPDDTELMTQLFRLVHTLKGNSGLFEFPEMTRVLHAGEDLMDAVRHGRLSYSRELADRLLDAMDFVGMLCDAIEAGRQDAHAHADEAVRLAQALRALKGEDAEAGQPAEEAAAPALPALSVAQLWALPEAVRQDLVRQSGGRLLHWLLYRPDPQCFFQGDDPLYRALQTPGLLWRQIRPRGPWAPLATLDPFDCQLDLEAITAADPQALSEHYRYVPDQRRLEAFSPWCLVRPEGDPNGGPVYEDFMQDAQGWLEADDLSALGRAVDALLDLSSPALWFASALRWMRTLLQMEAVPRPALRALVASLADLQPPDILGAMDRAERADGDAPGPREVPLENPESPAMQALVNLVETQREVLALPDDAQWLSGRLAAAARVLAGCLRQTGREAQVPAMQAVAEQARGQGSAQPLAAWLEAVFPEGRPLTRLLQVADPAPVLAEATVAPVSPVTEVIAPAPVAAVRPAPTPAPSPVGGLSGPSDDYLEDDEDVVVLEAPPRPAPPPPPQPPSPPAASADAQAEATEAEGRSPRRGEDAGATRSSLKVDQAKIDRLMNLIGEMVVAKNAIPYLASRAEQQFGVRELAREIKAQYAVINRISEEMQDAIMQVRMMPVSFIFQRFPRLVRDTSRRLGKEVNLVLDGQETAADKNIIESLGDPLVHIVRNSLDHGIETPEVRQAAGKPAVGTLRISARQESDRVVIEIHDDGKGMDPVVIKRKAWEKGLIDEAAMERMSDQEAIHLIFAPGFSTADVVSDLSGRGVGMDVVRTAVERVHGNVSLESVKGQGTRIRLSLPLSMAVTNVMTIEADGQVFGVPMDTVVETVRVPAAAVRRIKQSLVATLRGRIVPLKPLNQLLGLAAPPLTNDSEEYAVLVVRVGDETVGLLVDNFRETADIILKPLAGVLGGLSAYAGSALMGDGSVLMVLNVKEMV
ncbi:chemotaxis protein CheA [Ideonella livida]|uniref:Chemotaxis protein CheA n=1 Tax=Ideonella livida TaxID=2707176 RepID=A0A7C9PFC4_9BURK|nr:chemotaxis protein CheA [Ideonella livida]NDY90493.1 chemotaxis protein CheA [Ideonella livida]